MELKELLKQQSYRSTSNITTTNSIELPEVIDNLIDNKMYRNKFKKLVREGHLESLLKLAEIATEKDKPSHWFSKVCAKARWANTLTWLKKLQRIASTAAEVIKKLQAKPEQFKAIYKACWKRSDVIRHAITAVETGRSPFKYFNWLVWKT